MKGMIYLPGLDKVFKWAGIFVKVGFIVGVLSFFACSASKALKPEVQAAKAAARILAEETEQTFRFCIRKAKDSVEIQGCKDQFTHDYK